MRPLAYVGVMEGLLCLMCLCGVPAYAENRALLMGINDYAWDKVPPLKGCENDVRGVRDLLRSNFGFQEHGIRMLLSREATVARIKEEFVEFLVKGTRPGDWAVFYYGGHGTQARDYEKDEEDGKDEIFLGADSQESGPVLKDDDLWALLKQLPGRTKLVLLDCAHSDGDGVLPETILLTSCQPEQVAMDMAFPTSAGATSHHGVFTYYLLEGLRGPADADGSGKINTQEAYAYVCGALKREGYQQEPALYCPKDLEKALLFGANQRATKEAGVSAEVKAVEDEIAKAEAQLEAAKERLQKLQKAQQELETLKARVIQQEERVRAAKAEAEAQTHVLDAMRLEMTEKEAQIQALTGE